jgi:hypothetical protein
MDQPPFNQPGQPQPTAPKPARKMPVDPADVEKLTKDLNSISANIRILEERYGLMRSRSQVAEEGMIEMERSLSKDFKNLTDDIMDLKHAVKEITDNLRLISSEINNLAKKDELKVLEKYLDFWQPMNFVTRAEMEKLMKEKHQ